MTFYGTPKTTATLTDAVRKGKYGQARLMVEAGTELDMRTETGDTALILCCDPAVDLAPQTRINLVKLLVESGADTNCQNVHGVSALMKAVGLGCRQIVSLIATNPATKAGLQDCEGNTALMLAAAAGLGDLVPAILAPSTRLHQMFLLNQVNNHGLTAAQKAVANGHDNVAAALGGSFFNMQASLKAKFPSPNLLNVDDSSPSPSSSPERSDVASTSKPNRDEFDKVLKFLDAAIRGEDASWDGKEDDNRLWTPEGSSMAATKAAADTYPDRSRKPRLVGGNFFPPIRNLKAVALLNDKYLKKRLSHVCTTNLNV